jgi:hypothetical protein
MMTLDFKTVSTISMVTLATVGMFFAPDRERVVCNQGPGSLR